MKRSASPLSGDRIDNLTVHSYSKVARPLTEPGPVRPTSTPRSRLCREIIRETWSEPLGVDTESQVD